MGAAGDASGPDGPVRNLSPEELATLCGLEIDDADLAAVDDDDNVGMTAQRRFRSSATVSGAHTNPYYKPGYSSWVLKKNIRKSMDDDRDSDDEDEEGGGMGCGIGKKSAALSSLRDGSVAYKNAFQFEDGIDMDYDEEDPYGNGSASYESSDLNSEVHGPAGVNPALDISRVAFNEAPEVSQ